MSTDHTIKPSEALRTIVESLTWEEQRSGTTYHGFELARAAIHEAERLERERDRYRKALERLACRPNSIEDISTFVNMTSIAQQALEPGE